MAAKTKVTAKAVVAKKLPASKAPPKGLQLTTAQQNAYNRAYSTTATALRRKLAIQAGAATLRKSRLSAASSIQRTYAHTRAGAQAAAVAAYATRRSWVQSRLAHQNTALMNRVEQDMARHATLLGRLQYAQAGEKAYAHTAVMRTLDQAQAISAETAYYNKLNAVAKKAVKSTKGSYKPGPNSAAVRAAASRAGLSAAKKIPVPRTAPYFGPGLWGKPAGKLKPASDRQWIGDEFTPNCVITAVANHLLYCTGVIADEASVRELAAACPEQPVIEEVLWQGYLTHFPRNSVVHLKDYRPVAISGFQAELGAFIIGYAAMTDDGRKDHAALSLADGRVVSWGAVTKRDAEVEEAWELEWAR